MFLIEGIKGINSAIWPQASQTVSNDSSQIIINTQSSDNDAGLETVSFSNLTTQETDENGIIHTYTKNENGTIIFHKAEYPNNDKDIYYFDENGNDNGYDSIMADGSRVEMRISDDIKFLTYKNPSGNITKDKIFYSDGSERERLFDSEGNKTKVIQKKQNIIIERDCTSPDFETVTGKKDGQIYLTGQYDKDNNLIYIKKTVNGKEYEYSEEDLRDLSHETKKNLVLNPNMIIGEKLLSDIKMVREAEQEALKAGEKDSPEYKKAYDTYIKTQLIKTPENMENITGEVVEKDGKLFVNDGNGLRELKISAEKYMELFPPIKRFDTNQSNIGDCYFLAPLSDMMQRPKGFAKILQMFSEDENGNITVEFSKKYERNNKSVIFPNGRPLEVDGKVGDYEYPQNENRSTMEGSSGIIMMEQAFALNRYAKAHNYEYKIENIDIDLAMHEEIDGGYPGQIYGDIFGMWGFSENSEYYTTPKYFDSIDNKIKNDERIYSVYINYDDNGNIDTSLMQNHVYNIQAVDKENRLIYLINPHSGGCNIVMTYDDFKKSLGTSPEQRTISTALF